VGQFGNLKSPVFKTENFKLKSLLKKNGKSPIGKKPICTDLPDRLLPTFPTFLFYPTISKIKLNEKMLGNYLTLPTRAGR
jgi:hypothetical protein